MTDREKFDAWAPSCSLLGPIDWPTRKMRVDRESAAEAAWMAATLAERERAAQVCERMALRQDDIRRAALQVAAENIRQL